ncbi:oxygenase MpaB family protein [Nocardia higoensis]|uniref:oxygenase MpaB family protein n=1 Tax=Nocardia higoensis TaxID=228599 RepID=UPI000594C8B5|nr:oxygenase MpaB family protein [Nocardia higoensis]
MSAPLRATTPEQVPSSSYGTADDFRMEDFWYGITAFLGGSANVVMQLSHAPVAYGVLESTVDSGKVMLHPIKRLRTTLTYLAVALMGTEEEREAYRQAVNTSHRTVRSDAQSPVKYNAFDPKLQLWVAACLYFGILDLHERLHGELDEATADALYAYSVKLGTGLQMRPEMWPADRAAFQQYWDTELPQKKIDARTKAYFDDMIDLKMMPVPVQILGARFHRFVVTGLLPEHLRNEMGMTWSPIREHTLRLLLLVIGKVQSKLPKAARLFPMNYYLWDFRKRLRSGRPLV